MNRCIQQSKLQGTVLVPSSKSFAHRQLIAAALSDKPTQIIFNTLSEDIFATMDCVLSLGADITKTEEGILCIEPAAAMPKKAHFSCKESGSTLRFMLPVAAALGIDATFTGTGRLPERPNAVLTEALRQHNVQADRDFLPLHLSGKLTGGLYEIAGNISSQYITGLLLALPLCQQDSRIRFTTPVESADYIEITLQVLSQFGIKVEKEEDGYSIPGNQAYRTPGVIITEGDWSSAVFWHCANQMGSRIQIDGLNPASCQGDRRIVDQLLHLGGVIDVSQTPDSLPALAVAACTHPGTTHFVGAGRLRIKESDRLSAITFLLRELGQDVTEEPDGLIVRGGTPFTAGTVDGCNDHRIVMAAAIAACFAKEPVTILGTQAVNKSYPRFFDDLISLGGKIHG